MILKLATLFYFSGTGNTWWVTKEIAKRLNDKGFDCQYYSIELEELKDPNNLLKIVRDCGLIGIGYPIYGSEIPDPMRNFLNILPHVNNKPTLAYKQLFIYCTQMIFSGDGSYFIRKLIEPKGYHLQYTAHFNMPNNLTVPKAPFAYIKSQDQIDKILFRTSKKINKITSMIDKDHRHIEGKNPIARFAGWTQRVSYHLSKASYRRKFGINISRCTKCGLCSENCPTQNIEMGQSGPIFKKDCTLCLRCYNYCPQAAIKFGKILHDVKKVLLYHGPELDFSLSKFYERKPKIVNNVDTHSKNNE
jgi:NAD-dependent dihydropyrimidine dehydrogenase PreA subunit/flavodoxin